MCCPNCPRTRRETEMRENPSCTCGKPYWSVIPILCPIHDPTRYDHAYRPNTARFVITNTATANPTP